MPGVKMTGAEYNAFTATEWGPDWYWDETLFKLNGKEVEDIGICAETDEVIILEGLVFKGQEHDSPTIDALAFARKWLKAQTVVSLIVEVPKDQVDTFKAEMAEKGIRVLKA